MRLLPEAYSGIAAATLLGMMAACGGGGGGSTPVVPPIGSTPTPLPIQTPTPAPASASGTLVDDAGTPISGATVSLAPFQTPPPTGAPEPTPAPAITTTTTSANGAYVFAGVPAGKYLLSAIPQDASAIYSPPPATWPTPDPANAEIGTYLPNVHASLHEAVTINPGANALPTKTVVRLSDNDLLCAQIFEQARSTDNVPRLPVDSDFQVFMRQDVAHLASTNQVNWPDPNGGAGRYISGEGAFHTGSGCPIIAYALTQDNLAGTSDSYVGMSNSTAGVYGPAGGVVPMVYP